MSPVSRARSGSRKVPCLLTITGSVSLSLRCAGNQHAVKGDVFVTRPLPWLKCSNVLARSVGRHCLRTEHLQYAEQEAAVRRGAQAVIPVMDSVERLTRRLLCTQHLVAKINAVVRSILDGRSVFAGSNSELFGASVHLQDARDAVCKRRGCLTSWCCCCL